MDDGSTAAAQVAMFEAMGRALAARVLDDAGVAEKVESDWAFDLDSKSHAQLVFQFELQNVDREYTPRSGTLEFQLADVSYGFNEGAYASSGVTLFEYEGVSAVLSWRGYCPEYCDDNCDASLSGAVHVALPAEAQTIFQAERSRLLADHAGGVARILTLAIGGAAPEEVGAAVRKAMLATPVDPACQAQRAAIMAALSGSAEVS